jgi:hypothetical protein
MPCRRTHRIYVPLGSPIRILCTAQRRTPLSEMMSPSHEHRKELVAGRALRLDLPPLLLPGADR